MPSRMRRLAASVFVLGVALVAPFGCGPTSPAPPPAVEITCPGAPAIAPAHGLALTGYHGGPARTGWSDAESDLTPDRVASLALAWCAPPLDAAVVDGTRFAPHLYASPLVLDDVAITGGTYQGAVTGVVIVATSNGDAYAIAAADARAPDGAAASAGAILWRAHLTTPSQPLKNLDGVPFGVLGTPVVDLAASPPRVYVASADATRGWMVFALDLGSGATLPGWPIVLDGATVQAANANADPANPATFGDFHGLSQRGALNLAGHGAYLYVGFGSYFDGAVGWMIAIDTRAPRVAASYSGARSDVPKTSNNLASAGMWGAGGAVVDAQDRVFVTTGNSPPDSAAAPGVWGNSVLQWQMPLALQQTYSPFNYCSLDVGDTDLGGSSPIAFDLDPARTSTPHLAAFGSKQGDVYLVDRDALGGKLDARPACNAQHLPAPTTDTSLYGADVRGYYTPPSRGPLSVFGPYSDVAGANEVNNAKMRTAPALYEDASGNAFLFVSGNSRSAAAVDVVVAPSLARLRVVTTPGAPAYLSIDALAKDVVFKNPGPPIVTSSRSAGAVVWVLDENAQRTDALVPGKSYTPPRPVVYAFDAGTMALLWQTQLPAPGGKYGHPAVAHGTLYVGADRLYAYRAP
jgi:PQQ-like domain